MAPLVKKELEKMVEENIIVPLRYSEWISNLVPSKKKIAHVRVCVYFRNLNAVSKKDNYMLPNMEIWLQRITKSEMMSLLDGLASFNQVVIKKEYRANTAFLGELTNTYECLLS